MRPLFARKLFISLLTIHPRSFRESFGTSMLQAFDEAAEEFGVGWLLWDGLISVARQQWASQLEQSDGYKSCYVVGLRSGVYPLTGPSRLTAAKLSLATLLSLILFQLVRPG